MKSHHVWTLVFVSALSAQSVALAKPGGGGGPSRGGGMDISPASHPAMPPADRGSLPKANTPVANGPRSAAPAAQSLSDTMQNINQTAFDQRKALLDSVDRGMKSSHEQLQRIQDDARASRTDAHVDFKAALVDVKAREKDLEAAVKASRAAADEMQWNARRDELAKATQNLNAAMTKLDAARLAPKLE